MRNESVPEGSASVRSPRRTVEASVVIPTRNRTDALLRTINRILACEPAPAEVLVHVDGGDSGSAEAVHRHFTTVKLTQGTERIGPGGGRNLLVSAARHDIVASFDDDSFPLDSGYFARLADTFARDAKVAVVSAQIFHRGESPREAREAVRPSADFVACGCAFRRSAFEAVGGFVPLSPAYGMEESDFALRVHAAGYAIVSDAALRVYHDTDLGHHESAEVTKASLRNLALLAYLRYPPILWWLGAAQVARRVAWLIAHGRLDGLMSGLVTIPAHLHRYRAYRRPVSARDVRGWIAARRRAASQLALETG